MGRVAHALSLDSSDLDSTAASSVELIIEMDDISHSTLTAFRDEDSSLITIDETFDSLDTSPEGSVTSTFNPFTGVWKPFVHVISDDSMSDISVISESDDLDRTVFDDEF